jgi:hypothetical protein
MGKTGEKPIRLADIEFHADAWTRFQRATDVVAKSPPQHRVAKKAKKPAKNASKRQKEKN